MANKNTQETWTRKRGRPPKNVIWGTPKSSSWRGRPPKNIIQPRKSKTSWSKSKKSPLSKKSTSKKNTVKITKNIKAKQGFSTHKVHTTNGKENSFAFWLLIASILLFGFSLYKAFFQQKSEPIISPTETNYTIESLTGNILAPEMQNTGEVSSTTGVQLMYQGTGDETATTETTLEETQIQTEIYTLPAISFSKSFNLWELDAEIETLQKFLSNEAVYTGTVNGTFDEKTINGVYQFQLKYKILTEDSDKRLKGFFGPGTRAKANELITQYIQ